MINSDDKITLDAEIIFVIVVSLPELFLSIVVSNAKRLRLTILDKVIQGLNMFFILKELSKN